MPQIRDLSDEQLIKEYHHWDDKVRNATAWVPPLLLLTSFVVTALCKYSFVALI